METISAVRRIRKQPRHVARCRASKEEQGKVDTIGQPANDFLKHRFLPLCEPAENLPEQQLVEKGFFQSLSILNRLHGLHPMDVSDKPYPCNILLAYWDCLHQLNTTNQEVEVLIIQDEQDAFQLATKQVYTIGTTLYYIPVMPLYRLLQDKAQKNSAELLLSVFAYLYHIARIPYYRDEYSALNYHYEMTKEWLCEDVDGWEETDLRSNLSEIAANEYVGDLVYRKIYNLYNLNHLQERIEKFRPNNPFQQQCLAVAKDTLDLFTRYPNRSVFHHIIPSDDDAEVIRAEQYISFIAANEGWVADNIFQMINNELNECGEMEEPIIEQVFDNPQESLKEGLDFEQKLFPLTADLCTLLNDIP